MKRTYLILLLIFTACTLNADQELSLNKALNAFVEARNEGSVMTYVASTHPQIVAFYKAQGDSAFLHRFDLSGQKEFIQDGVIEKIKKDGNRIQVLYKFVKISDPIRQSNNDFIEIIAFSEDQGKSWFFAEKEDFLNNQIINSEDLLLEIE